MTNPLKYVDGIGTPMDDEEYAAFLALQAAEAAALNAPEALLAYAAAVRYKMEIAGVTCTIGGESDVPVSTGRGNDRTILVAEFVSISSGIRGDGEPFKFNDGVIRSVSNADMMAACSAALLHVKTCFALEQAVAAAIQADPPTITDRAAVDAAFAG